MAHQTPARHTCRICGRSSFNTAHALNRHLKQSFCGKAVASGGSCLINGQNAAGFIDTLPRCPPINQPKKRPLSRIETDEIDPQDLADITTQIGDGWEDLSSSGEESLDDCGGIGDPLQHPTDPLTCDNLDNLDQKPATVADKSEANTQIPDYIDHKTAPPESDSTPDAWIPDQFKAYCAHAKQHFAPFTEHEKEIICLLHLLKEKNAPLHACEPVMLWHKFNCSKENCVHTRVYRIAHTARGKKP